MGWCTAYERAHERPPSLWFDKVCINQTNIQADLQCLPIFLAGCNRLLIICGLTYTSRLWCCVELFVFVQMADKDSHATPIIRIIGADEEQRARVQESWTSFDAKACNCFNESDKTRI